MAGNKARKRFLRLLSTLVVALLGVIAVLRFAWSRSYRGFSGGEKFLVVARGTSAYDVARVLQREGIVRHWALFLSYMRLAKPGIRLQAGEYRFDVPLSTIQTADKLIHGWIYYHELTIPEGFSSFDIADLLEQRGLSSAQDFLAAAGNAVTLSGLNVEAGNLEGFLFPDTYRLARGTTPQEIAQIMVKRFREIYEALGPEIKQSALSFTEILTLASLIEKETGVDAERELVSAVFHNRLKKRMLLQCDPTVIYAARLKGNYRGRIFQSDLDFDSPYNTYRRLGLPPGPIANPGKRSIEAALKPAKVDFLYFVANNIGGHVFSRTLAEHRRAVAAYRRGQALRERHILQAGAARKG